MQFAKSLPKSRKLVPDRSFALQRCTRRDFSFKDKFNKIFFPTKKDKMKKDMKNRVLSRRTKEEEYDYDAKSESYDITKMFHLETSHTDDYDEDIYSEKNKVIFLVKLLIT